MMRLRNKPQKEGENLEKCREKLAKLICLVIHRCRTDDIKIVLSFIAGDLTLWNKGLFLGLMGSWVGCE